MLRDIDMVQRWVHTFCIALHTVLFENFPAHFFEMVAKQEAAKCTVMAGWKKNCIR